MTTEILDIDLDLDIDLPTYDGPIFDNCFAAVQYQYQEMTYNATGGTAVIIIHRLTDKALINLAIEQRVLYHFIQQEIDKRQLGNIVSDQPGDDLDDLDL